MGDRLPTDLNDPQQRRDFRRKLAETGISQVRHFVAMKTHYNPSKQAVAVQWIEDVESGASLEDDMADLADAIDALKQKFNKGDNITGHFLGTEDQAVARGLFTQAAAFIDQRFGQGSSQSRTFVSAVNAGQHGFMGGPSYSCVADAAELLRSYVKISQRMPRKGQATPSITAEPKPGDYPLEHLPSNSSFHLRGLSNDDLAKYIAGWRPGTENHIIGMGELERRKNMPSELPPAAKAASGKPTYVDPKRLAEIEALVSAKWDFSRLVQLCRELNAVYGDEHYIMTAAAVRIIMDHVPPLFGFADFDQVAANYGGPKTHKSFKGSMQHLQKSMRNISDAQIHSHIRQTDALPNATQVDVRNDLDVLLEEVVRLAKIP